MRSITLAFGSFIVGAIFMSLFGNGNHISNFRHPRLAFAEATRVNSFVPVVPPPSNVVKSNNFEGLQLIELDGMNSIGETLFNSKIRYGGGAYRLINAQISGETQVEFIGAAANTVAFLPVIGLTVCPIQRPAAQPPAFNPNAPIIKSATLTMVKGDLVTPYSGKQQ